MRSAKKGCAISVCPLLNFKALDSLKFCIGERGSGAVFELEGIRLPCYGQKAPEKAEF